jgi:predicted O-methyltransferase YrrM
LIAVSDFTLQLAARLDRLRWRFPAPMRDSVVLLRLCDRLTAAHWLAAARRTDLLARMQACRSAADWHATANHFLAPQQISAEIIGFLDYAAFHAPRTVVEIGTASGGTHFLLGAALPSVTLKVGVDLFVRNTRLLETFARPGCTQRFVHGSSRDAATVAAVRTALSEQPIDLLFIDGDHSYAGVRADFELYAPLVRPGGLIAFHDIVPDYRTRYGRDTGRYAGDVPRFWREIRDRFAETREFVADPHQDGLGIGVGRMPTP